MLDVEIKGISFSNKGAELMLTAIQEQFRARNIAARFVVEPNFDFSQRSRYGVWPKNRHIYKRLNILAPVGWLPQRIRRLLGIVKSNEIDCVLDASGFSYGDFWSSKVAADRLGTSVKKLTARGVPVVLLPQALGPFNKSANAKAFIPILAHADIVFARDQMSLEHAQRLPVQPKKLQQAPDFTCLVEPEPPRGLQPPKQAVCFITNEKMATDPERRQRYLAWMIALVRQAQALAVPVYFVQHGGLADQRLAEEIIAQCDPQIPFLSAADAKQTKWLIGQSKVVVGSRFHALVSALSQGIPVIATSWSHKYQALLSDYQCTAQLYSCEQEREAGEQLQQLLTDPSFYQQQQQQLQACAKQQKSLTKAMWEEVFQILDAKLSSRQKSATD